MKRESTHRSQAHHQQKRLLNGACRPAYYLRKIVPFTEPTSHGIKWVLGISALYSNVVNVNTLVCFSTNLTIFFSDQVEALIEISTEYPIRPPQFKLKAVIRIPTASTSSSSSKESSSSSTSSHTPLPPPTLPHHLTLAFSNPLIPHPPGLAPPHVPLLGGAHYPLLGHHHPLHIPHVHLPQPMSTTIHSANTTTILFPQGTSTHLTSSLAASSSSSKSSSDSRSIRDSSDRDRSSRDKDKDKEKEKEKDKDAKEKELQEQLLQSQIDHVCPYYFSFRNDTNSDSVSVTFTSG